MKGFRDAHQRWHTCNLLASWLEESGCGFVPLSDDGPSIYARASANLGESPSGAALSPGQMAILRLMLDVWYPGLGNCLVAHLDQLDEVKRRAVARLMHALAVDPDCVDGWLDEHQYCLSTTQQGGYKGPRRTRE